MQQDAPFTEEQRRAAEKIAKLLALGGRNPSAEEAASAMKRAADLALAYNLDLEAIGASGDEGTRLKEKTRGGFYSYQQDIWRYVAELNFCLYFTSGGYAKKQVRRKDPWTGDVRVETDLIWQKYHGLVGRKHNVAATKAMATYLEQAIERQLMERLGNDNNQRFSRWAVSFRKGAVHDICNRLWERREELMAEEARKAEEARRKAEEAGMSTASGGSAVTIASVKQSEDDANRDEFYGLPPGTTARQRAERLAQQAAEAAAKRQADEEYARWAAEHPEEARRKEAEARKEREKAEKRRARSYGRGGSSSDNIDWGAFRAGSDVGAKIGLDPQAGAAASAGGIGHG